MEPTRPRVIVTKDSYSDSRMAKFRAEFERIKKWKPTSDVWAIRYGPLLLGTVATISGLYVNARIRRRLKLFTAGYFISYGSVTAAPALLIGIIYPYGILDKLLVGPLPCPVCLETKAVLLQSAVGTIYPLLISPIVNIAAAEQAGYNIPAITEVRKIGKFVYSVYKPLAPGLLAISVLNAIVATLIFHRQSTEIKKVQTVRLLKAMDNQKQNYN